MLGFTTGVSGCEFPCSKVLLLMLLFSGTRAARGPRAAAANAAKSIGGRETPNLPRSGKGADSVVESGVVESGVVESGVVESGVVESGVAGDGCRAASAAAA